MDGQDKVKLVAQYLLDAGFKEYCVFENRKPRLLAFGK